MAISGTLVFLSASEIGAYMGTADGGRVAFYGHTKKTGQGFVPAGLNAVDDNNNLFIPNDFVGLNTNIYEPITSSQNLVGYPSYIAEKTNLELNPWLNPEPGINSGFRDFTYMGGLIESWSAGGAKGVGARQRSSRRPR